MLIGVGRKQSARPTHRSGLRLSERYESAEFAAILDTPYARSIGKRQIALEPGSVPAVSIGVRGPQLSFSGTQYLTTPSIGVGAEFTVLVGQTPRASNNGYDRMVETDYANSWFLGCNSSGANYCWIVNNASLEGCIGGSPTIGTRDLVVGTFAGSTRTLYVNGAQVASASATAPTPANRAMAIARQASGAAGYWEGEFDLLVVLPFAITAAEVRAVYEDEIGVLFAPRRIWMPVSAGGSSLDLTQTTGVSLAGTVATSGDIQIGTNFNLSQSSAVGLAGSLATTGDVQIGTTFNLAQTAAVGLAGSVGVSGDIQILSGSLDLTQTSAVAMSGTMGLSGDIQIGTSFDLAQTAAVGLTGSVATAGDVQIGTNFNLAQSVALAMSGSVAVAGDLQSGTAPVVTQAYGNFGWDPRIRPSWKRKELREELEAALDDAPKAVKILVETTTSPQAPEPLQDALATVRKARKYSEMAVTRQEIDELHEALETVATFTREREAARQARRRKQQHLLLLS